MLNGRKNIGIILFDITGYYQQQLVHTLSKTASKRGYNLLTFSAFTIYGSDHGVCEKVTNGLKL